MMASLRCFLHLSHRERSDRSCDPGEGMRTLDKPYALTPALSPWERGQTERLAGVFSSSGNSKHALPEEAR